MKKRKDIKNRRFVIADRAQNGKLLCACGGFSRAYSGTKASDLNKTIKIFTHIDDVCYAVLQLRISTAIESLLIKEINYNRWDHLDTIRLPSKTDPITHLRKIMKELEKI